LIADSQIDNALAKSVEELLRWKRSEENRQARLKEDHDLIREKLRQMPKTLRTEFDSVHDQSDHIQNRLDSLRSWIDTVVGAAKEDLEADHRKAHRKLRELSTQLTEEVEGPLQELLALRQDDQQGNPWGTVAGLLAVQFVTRTASEEQIASLMDHAVQVLAENSSPDGTHSGGGASSAETAQLESPEPSTPQSAEENQQRGKEIKSWENSR